jgi:hypothetical protein
LKDYLFHLRAADSGWTLFTENPTDRITDVRFTASVWTYYSSNPIMKLNGRCVREGLEPMNSK